MKKTFIFVIFSCIYMLAFGQSKVEKETSAIEEEGKLLYRSEMASWYGTDIMEEKYKNKRGKIEGYFSYVDDDKAKCVFYSKGDDPKAMLTITFDNTYSIAKAVIDDTERKFSKTENDLYTIREKAFSELTTDTSVKLYKNTNFNLIPLINKGKKKVFVLTGPKENGVVIFGNDYEFTFDKKNNLEGHRRIHNNIIETTYGKGTGIDSVEGGIHTHLASTSEFITSTDICTLMLYEKFANWKQYIVISKTYISMWSCKTDKLVIITKEAWDKIYKDQSEKHPGK